MSSSSVPATPSSSPHQPPAGPVAKDCREEAACGLSGPTRCPPSGCLSSLLLGCLGALEGEAREDL